MKPFRSLFAISLASLASVSLVFSQDVPVPSKIDLKPETTAADPSVKLDPTGKLPSANKDDALVPLQATEQKAKEMPAALKKLDESQRNQYNTLREEATSYMRSVRLQESLEKLSEAEKVVGEPLAEIENLRGAIYTKMRDFPTARGHFEKSLTLDKESFHPKFNLAELDFVEKKWSAALDSFTKLIAENEAMKKAATAKLGEEAKEAVERQFDTTTRLMQFKIMICQTQEKKSADAEKTLANFGAYDNDSPAYYFAKAVLAFVAEKKESAEEWISSAKSIYPAEVTEVYVDSLVEMGWLSTLQQ